MTDSDQAELTIPDELRIELTDLRTKAKRVGRVTTILGSILLVGAITYIAVIWDIDLIGMLVGLLGLVLILAPSSHWGRYRKLLKQAVIEGALQARGALTFETHPDHDVIRRFITDPLVPRYDKVDKCEDYVSGTFCGADLQILDVTLSRQNDHDSENPNDYNEVFSGLLIKLACPINATGTFTLIEGTAGFWGQRKNAEGDLIELERSDFSDRFLYYGTDQVEARKLMTPQNMERWASLTSQQDIGDICAVFADGYLNLSFEISGDWIDSAITRTRDMAFEAQVAEMSEDIKVVLDLIEQYLAAFSTAKSAI